MSSVPRRGPFPPSVERERRDDHQTDRHVDKDHGRLETRTLTSSTRLNWHLDWPGVEQVCRVERQRTIRGEKTTEVTYYITSLDRAQADAGQLNMIARRHWGAIENGVHYVRDEAFGEDRSPIMSGHAPQNLAALRNAGLNVLRDLGIDNITATLRSFARKPSRLFTKLGYPN